MARLPFVAILVLLVAAGISTDAAGGAGAVCENDAAFRNDVSIAVSPAGYFVTPVRDGLYLTATHDFRSVSGMYKHELYGLPLKGLRTPCSRRLLPVRTNAVAALAHITLFIRLFAAFPTTRPAALAQWLGVLQEARVV